MTDTKANIISKLRRDILLWDGLRPPLPGMVGSFGLGPVETVFTSGDFPTGAIHEFIRLCPEDIAACGGFVVGLVKTLLQHCGATLRDEQNSDYLGSFCLLMSLSGSMREACYVPTADESRQVYSNTK